MKNRKLKNRKITDNECKEFYVIINDKNEFLYHIYEDYENEGAVFTKNIKGAVQFRVSNRKIIDPRFYQYVNGTKVKNIYHLEQILQGKLIKVTTNTKRITEYIFSK